MTSRDASAELSALEPVVRLYLSRWISEPDDVADVSQECLVKIWTRRASFEGRSSMSSWIYKIARHEFLSWERRRPVSGARTGSPGRDATPSPEPRILAKIDAERWLDTLGERHRSVLELLYLHGLTSGEAGRRLGVADSTVRCWHRAALAAARG